MSFNQPDAPNPAVVAQQQQTLNTQSATSQNKANSFDQTNPYGSMSYVADPNSPSGYTLKTSLSAPQQGLLDTQTGTQAIAGQTGQAALRNSASMYSQPFNLDAATGATAQKLNQWQQQYQQPIFDQQSSNLEAQLRSQGLMPGTQAYDNAKNLLARNQGDVTNQYLTQNEGQAFNQALTQYGLPLQTAQSLFGMAAPNGGSFAPTPTAQIQPANYAGLTEQNYQQQMQNYQNTWNNVGKLGTAAAGLALAPVTGGLSLGATAGGLGSLFGSSPSYGGGSSLTNAYGGSSAYPLPGLSASDYGTGF